MVDMKVDLCGITLDNPVIPASGTFGFGKEFADLYDLDILGSISVKGTTPEPRYGNPLPRIAECEAGMLNSVGLQNPGIDLVCHKELNELTAFYHKPVIANISGFSIDDYVLCARAMDSQPIVGIIEVNVSCPNVHCGGMTRVQKERFFNEEDYVRLKDSYILNLEKLEPAKKDLIIMHPLPRVNEISVEVDSDSRACYFYQALCGKHIRMALILYLLGMK